MGYQALLFCADEKATRVVSQVLSELDFHVELCADAFSAVKRLTTEHFDALVVDCDDEQNAALLFKTAHNSEQNSASLAVALVQGQGGIAKAFKIGANLILTKPLNAEQSKGTLRVARGLLRKSEAGKAAAAALADGQQKTAAAEKSSAASAGAASSSSQALSSAVPSSATEAGLQDNSAVPGNEALTAKAHAATAASIETPAAAELGRADSKEISSKGDKDAWQAKTKTAELKDSASIAEAASAAKTAPAGKANAVDAKPAAEVKSIASGQRTAAAAAPARDKEKAKGDETPAPGAKSSGEKTASASSSAKKTEAAKPSSTGKREFGKSDAPATAASFSWSEAARDHEAAGNTDSKRNFVIAAVLVLALAGGGYFAWPQLAPYFASIPGAQKYLGSDAAPQQAAAPARVAPAPAPAAPQTAPSATGTAPTNSAATSAQTALAPATAAAVAPLALPQSVSEQLLVKKTPAVYPAAARQKKLAGDVQLQATVGKDGDVTDVKLLSGDETLAHAATDAVRQWKYKPYVVNGQPSEFETPVTVNFKAPR